MSLLLDTHVLLWWLTDDPRLGGTARAAIQDPLTDVAVSAVTVWEVSIKRALGKLDAPDDLPAVLVAERFSELPFRAAHGQAAGRLPRHHDDPFDRALVAQAVLEDRALVTSDAGIEAYEVRTLSARS